MAALDNWTDDKTASIDWSNPSEILAHRFSFLSLLPHHPKLEQHLDVYRNHAVRADMIRLFTDRRRGDEQRATLRTWFEKGLLTPRAERWCRRCGLKGHTLTSCGFIEDQPDNVHRHLEHVAELERVRMKEEQDRKHQERMARREDRGRGRGQQQQQQQQQQEQSGGGGGAGPAIVKEEWLRGLIRSVDYGAAKGEIVQDGNHEAYSFFIDRTEYGLKRIREKDEVFFHVEWYNMRPMAVDVTPKQQALSDEDIRLFLQTCDTTTEPIKQIRTILGQRQEFPKFLAALGPLTTSATHTIIRMTTFFINRLAVHTNVLAAFLGLLCEVHGDNSFFPNLVLRVLPKSPEEALGLAKSNPTFVDSLMDIADLCFLVFLHTRIDREQLQRVAEPVQRVLQAICDDAAPNSIEFRKAKKGLSFLARGDAEWLKTAVIPAPKDFVLPAACANSIFNPKNLPVNCSATPYGDVQAYVRAQAELLRADQFTACSQTFVAGAGFQVPGFEPEEHVMKDVEHARFYNNVRFLGRSIVRDYDMVDTYVFEAKIWRGKHEWAWALDRGTLVCIYTGADRTTFDPTRLFWGLTTDPDKALIAQGIFALHPCENYDFELLSRQLLAAEEDGTLESVIMMETQVFFFGYSPVMNALSQFLGPHPVALPLPDTIVHERPSQVPGKNVGYIPDYCLPAFEAIVNDIRGKLVLDPGQDEAMRSMATTPMMLIQGPPGTGKSFIGCRIVEAFVRYKQQLANGDYLANIDVSRLPHSDLGKLTPNLGPVVVITYKNHALDEFLLDLKRSGLWSLKNTGKANPRFPAGCSMVRVGGGSQESDLQGYFIGDILSAKAQARDVAQARGRVAIITKRMEKLANEIAQLLKGRVPPALFNSWLTDRQREDFAPTDLPEWLEGGRFSGKEKRPITMRFTQLLRAELLEKMTVPPPAPSTAATGGPRNDDSDDEDGQLSTFANMRREAAAASAANDIGSGGAAAADTKSRLRPTMVPREAVLLAKRELRRPADVPEDLQSLWSLTPQARHDYVAYRVQLAVQARMREYNAQVPRLETAITVLRHADDEAKLELLRSSDVVGLTTTGCAMNQNILRTLEPSILVVEEAAEVLESQLLACMSGSLKQIILIGDHFQLQPKVDTLALEKHNNMNVSMFERLVGRVKPIMLVDQRRMKPAISRLVRPFYKADTLRDHATVLSRTYIDSLARPWPSVPGLCHDVFFWKHNIPETEANRGRSKVNAGEATMAVALAEHLLSEGVRPASICVITPYLGQHRLIREKLQNAGKLMAEVRVSTVDRFQGDESDVIILSLVRTERLTEFLRLRNRMIVSCSRARFAMVIMGNDELLHRSNHWHRVLEMLEAEKLVGTHLPISTRFGTVDVPAGVPYAEWPKVYKRDRDVTGEAAPAEGSGATEATAPSGSDAAIARSKKRK